MESCSNYFCITSGPEVYVHVRLCRSNNHQYLYKRLMCVCCFACCSAFVGLFVVMRLAPNLRHFVRIAMETFAYAPNPAKNCVTKSRHVFVYYAWGTNLRRLANKPLSQCIVDPPGTKQLSITQLSKCPALSCVSPHVSSAKHRSFQPSPPSPPLWAFSMLLLWPCRPFHDLSALPSRYCWPQCRCQPASNYA